MRKTPTPESLALCMDGIGAEIADATEKEENHLYKVPRRKYTVSFVATFSQLSSLPLPTRTMTVAASSAEDAVRAVKAAHPDADIISVD